MASPDCFVPKQDPRVTTVTTHDCSMMESVFFVRDSTIRDYSKLIQLTGFSRVHDYGQ